MSPLEGWRRRALTAGTAEGRFHAHSYYDIPVFHPDGRRIAAHRMGFQGRWMTPEDAVAVGVVDAEGEGPENFAPVGESRAWSWQQGPMAQWRPGTGELVWNDREGGAFVARLHDPRTGTTRTLPHPVYALSPDGRFALSLNMARLDAVRPGYGYVGGEGAGLSRRLPREDGVRRMDLDGGGSELILPLARAEAFLASRLSLIDRLRRRLGAWREGRIHWFNHVKISPDGRRFTVKLRWKPRGSGWRGWMSASLTCGTDGRDLRLLARAASHVMWLDEERLYFWHQAGRRLRLAADRAPQGEVLEDVAPELIDSNVHIRAFPGSREVFVLDLPYREDPELLALDRRDGTHARIARFTGHDPAHGPFRCDLHPVPSPDGRRVAVTSLEGGGRQIHLLERDAPAA
jgi:hypothetical protein